MTLSVLKQDGDEIDVFVGLDLIGTIWLDDNEIECESAITGMSWTGYDDIDEAVKHLVEIYEGTH